MFITFEGMEGAGKSTQAQLLVGRLREKGYEVVATREPGGTRIGEQIRKITHDPENIDLSDEAEAYLMAAARAQHVREIIVPALEKGRIVICDRYFDSSLAYQGYGRELGVEVIEELNKLAILKPSFDSSTPGDSLRETPGVKSSALILPDLTICLKVRHEEGMRRRNNSYKIDRLDLQQTEFYRRVENGYNLIAKANPERIKVVDGNGTIEGVFEEVWKVVQLIICKT